MIQRCPFYRSRPRFPVGGLVESILLAGLLWGSVAAFTHIQGATLDAPAGNETRVMTVQVADPVDDTYTKDNENHVFAPRVLLGTQEDRPLVVGFRFVTTGIPGRATIHHAALHLYRDGGEAGPVDLIVRAALTPTMLQPRGVITNRASIKAPMAGHNGLPSATPA